MGSALASSRSLLEPAGTGPVRQGGSFWQLPTAAPPVPPHYQTLATQTQAVGDVARVREVFGRTIICPFPLEAAEPWKAEADACAGVQRCTHRRKLLPLQKTLPSCSAKALLAFCAERGLQAKFWFFFFAFSSPRVAAFTCTEQKQPTGQGAMGTN